MDKAQKLNRRDFLRIAGMTAATATIVACGGPEAPQEGGETAPEATSAPQPTTAPEATTAPTTAPETGTEQSTGQYKEAPMLAERVAAGDLPPVDERLPNNPLVIQHPWLTIGNYGGRLQFTNRWGGDGVSTIVHESMYGHSPLRWLEDGLSIGPGLVESWESNDDTSEWTLKFREGVKWSDGEPWTVDDILYWWEDMVLNEDHPEVPPDEGRSGRGTLAEFRKVDDYTLQLVFDAPAPLTADRLAMWVNAGIGPRWMAPRHYLEQFHPKYNSEYTDYEEHDQKMFFRRNPDCPTLTGWMCTAYEEGTRSVWERNPYYWCVDQEGNQLPYIDGIAVTGAQDEQVEKLAVFNGQIDWTHHWVLALTDVRTLRESAEAGNFEVRFWDSGSGSGQAYFFNYDFRDDNMRALIRTPAFRKALSHAVNRAEIQRNYYFDQGEPTTGTFSPKAIEYNINAEGEEVYRSWRDSAVEYNPELAMSLLDEIGVVDSNGDGFREMPDGSELLVTFDYSATADDQAIAINELIARDWEAIGIRNQLNPQPAATLEEGWRAGEVLSDADWGIGDGPNHLVFPQWLVPLEPSRWSPLHGKWYELRGTPEETAEQDVNPWERQPPRIGPNDTEYVDEAILRLWEIYDQSRVEPDPMRRHQLVWDMIRIHVENGPFVQGSIANFPRVFIVKNGLMNVPNQEDLALGGFTDPWIHPTPAVYDPETWYWDDPAAHS